MTLQAEANALMQAAEEFQNCKRNKSGSINESSRHAVKERLVKNLQAAGVEYAGAWQMAHNLGRKLAPK